jgi:serine/threonine protein kinase
VDRAKDDLFNILKTGNFQPMNLQSFFPIFRDCILGLTFMHINNIAHRNLKPGNIMAINQNKYVLADYSEGINLSFED